MLKWQYEFLIHFFLTLNFADVHVSSLNDDGEDISYVFLNCEKIEDDEKDSRMLKIDSYHPPNLIYCKHI